MFKLQLWSSFRGEASPYGTCRRRGGAHNGARGFAHLTLFHPWAQYCSSLPVSVFQCCACTFSYILLMLHCSTQYIAVPVFQFCTCTFSFSILHCSTHHIDVPGPVFQFQCSSVPLCTFSYILHGLHCSISQTFDQGSHSIDFPILWAQTRVLLMLWRQQGVERE